MLTTNERFQQLIEKMRLLERHITRQWVEGEKCPEAEEIKILQKELQSAAAELEDIYKTIKVFKTL